MSLFILTGIVNFITYWSVALTTSDVKSLLSAIFLFSASIGLEALSIWQDKDRGGSKIVFIAFIVLVSIFSAGWFLSIAGNSGFINFSIKYTCNGPRAIIEIPAKSLLPHFGPIDITTIMNLCGAASAATQFVLASRIARIRACRRKYNLQQGFYGK